MATEDIISSQEILKTVRTSVVAVATLFVSMVAGKTYYDISSLHVPQTPIDQPSQAKQRTLNAIREIIDDSQPNDDDKIAVIRTMVERVKGKEHIHENQYENNGKNP